jgi:hypothetical protein
MLKLSELVGNVVVFGVEHSGTSIVARMLSELGWWMPVTASNDCVEDVIFRKCSKFIERGPQTDRDPGILQAAQWEWMQRYSEHEPWVLKDPRLRTQLTKWWPIWGNRVTVLWVHRPYDAVRKSHVRRKRQRTGADTDEARERLRFHFEQCEREYAAWPGYKTKLEFEQFAEAMKN